MITIPRLKKQIKTNFFDAVEENLENELLNEIKKTKTDTLNKKLLVFIHKHIKIIVRGKPSSHKIIIDRFKNKHTHFYNRWQTSTGRKKCKTYKVLNDIFLKRYKLITNSKWEISYNFIENMGLKSCPYCNRNYISIVYPKDNRGRLRCEIDHFYPKAKYPFLAISIYNLIPSCQVCNHTKNEDDSFLKKDLINPYLIKEKDFSLSYDIESIDFINYIYNPNMRHLAKKNNNLIKVKFVNFKEGNISTFKLDTLYTNHNDIVLELITKKLHYPNTYISELKSLGFDDEDIYKFLYANYPKSKDFHNRPLSKLTNDIIDELNSL